MEELLSNHKLKQMTLTKGLVMDDLTPTHKVLFAMRLHQLGCVILTHQDRISSVFTERDFLKKVLAKGASWELPISTYASKNPITIDHDSPLKDALETMKKNGIRHLPVLNKQKDLMGVLSIRQLIQFFAEHFPADMMNLPLRLKSQASHREGE